MELCSYWWWVLYLLQLDSDGNANLKDQIIQGLYSISINYVFRDDLNKNFEWFEYSRPFYQTKILKYRFLDLDIIFIILINIGKC